MPFKIIPASPNWYCSKVTDSNNRKILVYGARHDVYIFGYAEFPPVYSGVFVGHREKVTALSLCDHDDYDTLCCSGSEDGCVKLWNTEDREVKMEHAIHSHRVSAICWSMQQSDLIISGDENGTLGIWQFKDNRQTAHRLDKSGIQCLAVSPFSAGLVAVGFKSGLIQLVDVKKGNFIIGSLKGHDEEIYTLDWCSIPGENFKPAQHTEPDITDLESFGVEESWRKPKPKELPCEEDLGTEGWLLASGSKDKTIRVWSTSKNRQLLLLKLPNPGRRDRMDNSSRGRPWLTLKWLKQQSCKIVSSSQSGDLLVWNIRKTGKERCEPIHATNKGHFRMAFNICPIGNDTKTICTISMDRQIIFWDVDLKYQIGVLPSLGGYVYAAKTSPSDPGRVALGMGDNMIRLWNLNCPSGVYDMTGLWQGIRSKVTALSWHPVKEGSLAYGTEDGRVGIYNTLSNKPPQISTTYHRRTVYVVTWGPPSVSADEMPESGTSYHVYSCGDGNLIEHIPHKLEREAVNISKLINNANPLYRSGTRTPTRSEISWNPDFTAVAIGNDDGTVEVYSSGNYKLMAVVQTHHKLINVVSWHPHVTMASPNGSLYKHYMAISSNESHITIVDLTSLFDVAERDEVLQVTQSWRKLEGHNNRVTGLAWSPHTDGHLVSVSYDSKALVWSIADNTAIACYQGHIGMLLCCQWSGLDPSEVITGGQDFSAHIWNIQEHPVQPGQLETKKKKSKKSKTTSKSGEPHVVMETTQEKVISQQDHDDLEHLLEKKRLELLGKESTPETSDNSAVPSTGKSPNEEVIPRDAAISTRRDNVAATTGKKSDRHDGKRKYKPKSMFPELSKLDNRGKQFVLDDLVTLAKLIYEGKSAVDPGKDTTHLGLFLDRRATYACLAVEGEHHRHNENMDYFYQLEVWKGNVSGALRVARQRDELSDWLVAMAPMASFDTWTSVCEDYAVQLETDGQYHKAASYFLACHKVYEAIRLFKRHKLFKEAIALAKVRLSPLDPALEELYTLWAQQLTKDGNYEQAAKCHLAMKQVQDAAKLLARRYDQSSLRTAAHISMIGNDKQQGLMYTQRVIQQHLLQNEWSDAYSFLKSQKDLQVYLACSSIHEMFSCELTTLGILNLNQNQFTKWDQKHTSKTPLPDFILDPGDVDGLSPWQQHLIQGHTFPHHILRTWYSHFDISMDTTSIEDMYKTLCLLHAGRQAQVELPLILIQVCTDLTLCLLSLMMSETPTAMSHLLQAVGSLQEAGHLHVMQGLLRLFLPQGPKYILKLQQEVTAMRVMISMDTHSHVDGASKVHTIKRYLSEHKDESVINTGSLRCRELDCLRAYYYVAILNFLKESCFSGEGTDQYSKESLSGEVTKSYSRENSDSGYVLPDPVFSGTDIADENESSENMTSDGLIDENGNSELNNRTDSVPMEKLDSSPKPEQNVTDENAQCTDSNETTRTETGKTGSGIVESKNDDIDKLQSENSTKTEEVGENVNCDITKLVKDHGDLKSSSIDSKIGDIECKSSNPESKPSSTETALSSSTKNGDSKTRSIDDSISLSQTLSQSKESSPSALHDKPESLAVKNHSRCQMIPVLNVNHYSITVARLAQLSQGLLWDLQAKRFALTETLGYIHKAISQLLLSKNSQSSDTPVGPDNEAQSGEMESNEQGSERSKNETKPEDGQTNRSRPEEQSSETAQRSGDSAAGGELSKEEGAVAMATEKSFKGSESQSGSSSVQVNHGGQGHVCDHHGNEHHIEGHLCHSVLSHHFDQMLNIHVPHVGEVPVHSGQGDSETELKCNFFEVCSSCELLHKSRKILFEDEPRFHTRPDVGFKDMTNITNPAKYINVPDEWYGMPVDQKYFKRYITMAILKDEQEYVMGELKRGPDSTQSPFPNPLESVKSLLDLADHSSHVSTVERQEFVQKVITWALNFAVTTQQKQTFVNLLQTHLEN